MLQRPRVFDLYRSRVPGLANLLVERDVVDQVVVHRLDESGHRHRLGDPVKVGVDPGELTGLLARRVERRHLVEPVSYDDLLCEVHWVEDVDPVARDQGAAFASRPSRLLRGSPSSQLVEVKARHPRRELAVELHLRSGARSGRESSRVLVAHRARSRSWRRRRPGRSRLSRAPRRPPSRRSR